MNQLFDFDLSTNKMEAQTNWSPENELDIHEILQESTNFPTGELEDLLDEDKCLSLLRPTTGEAEECYVKLLSKTPTLKHTLWPDQIEAKCPRPKLFLGVVLLSEARVVEVCSGPHQEYLRTVHGELLGDFGDSKIYKCEFRFDKPKEAVWLKLKSTCHAETVWIYGLHVVTTLDTNNVHTESRFGHVHLSSVLQEKDVQMSKDAIRFRHMLEAFNSAKNQSDEINGNNPMAFMSMLIGPAMSQRCSPASPYLDVQGKSQITCKNGNSDESKSEYSDCSSLVNAQKLKSKNGNTGKEQDNYSRSCTGGEGKVPFTLESKLEKLSIYSESVKCQEETEKSEASVASAKKEAKMNFKMQQGNFAEQLFTLLDKGGGLQAEEDIFGHLINMAAKIKTGEPTLPADLLKSVVTSDTTCSPQPKSNSSYRRLPLKSKTVHESSTQEDYLHLLPEKRSDKRLEEGNWESRAMPHILEQSDSLTGSETMVKLLEDVIERKFAAMEEKILQKMEHELSAKAREDSVRLERIEGLLSKICDKL